MTKDLIFAKIQEINKTIKNNRSEASKAVWEGLDKTKRIPFKHTKQSRELLRQRCLGNNYRKKIENIKQLDLEGNLVKIWKHSKEIVIFYGLKNATPILRVLKGERKTYDGYKWKV